MSAEAKSNLPLEIAHVLFIDIVGYSKLLIDDQHDAQQQLSRIVRSTNEFRVAEGDGKLVRLPTGDGMALVFFSNPEAPVQCATEVAKALKNNPTFELRMGIHSGAVSGVTDVNERSNVAGAGINMAQRVMDCGDAGHILLSKRAAEDLTQYSRWHQYLHDLGECEVKHGVLVSLFSLYNEEIGNSEIPKGIKQRRSGRAGRSVSTQAERIFGRKQVLGIVALLLFLSAIVIWLVQAQRRQISAIQKQGEQVTAIVSRYQKMEQALVRLAEVEAQAKEPGAKLSPEEQRARAYSLLENELGLPTGVLEKELPAFALELYNRSDTTPLMRARAAYALGKFDEAEKLSSESATQDRQGYKTVQRVAEDLRKHAVEGYVLAGQSAQKRIQYARAMEHFREAEKLTNRDRHPEEWAEVQHAIAYLSLDQGQYRDAENILQTVVEVRTHMIGSENPDTLMSRNHLGYALWEEGKYAEAEAQYRDVIKLDEKVLGPEHPDTLWSRNGLAITLNLQGKYAEAEAQYRDVIKLREKVLGPQHRLTLVSLMDLAFVLNAEGKYAEAEAQYHDVIKTQEKVVGPEHPDTLLSRHNLAIVLDAEGKYVEEEAQYRELIKIQGKVLGPEHPQTLMSRGNLGVALWNQGKYAEAETQYRDVIKLDEKVLGPEHPNTLSFRSNLADALGNQGKYAEAEAEYRDVIKLCEKVLGPEHPDTLDSRRALAWTLGHREGKYADAEAESRSVIKLLEKHIAEDNPLMLSTRDTFADALEGQGKYADAEAEYRSVMKLQEKVLGPEHPNTLGSRSGLAKTLMAEGKDAAAEMQQVIQLREKAIGPEHPDTLESCYDFAFGLEHQGKIQEAEEFAKRAAEGARKVLGPDHPDTKKYEKLLHELE